MREFTPPIQSDLDSILQHWESLTNLERDRMGKKREYRLDRMEQLCAFFDHPQRACEMIHLAGSKGKGSTAAMGAFILSEQQGPVGLYTSPHLQDYRERFTLLPPSEQKEELLLQQAGLIEKTLSELPEGRLPGGDIPTTFELLTLLGFLFFRAANCTTVFLETGLGGRLDATNVVEPAASIITPIELEHRDFLGDSLTAIAREKGGIIKKETPVFLARQPEEALQVFRTMAEEKQAPLYYLPDYLDSAEVTPLKDASRIQLKWKKKPSPGLSNFTCSMLGDVQAYNAALIQLCLSILKPELTEMNLQRGLEQAHLPGRGQWIPGTPSMLIDGAHTPHSLASVVKSFMALSGSPRILLFGCAIDKDVRALAEILKDSFDKIFITRPGSFKKSDPPGIGAIFQELGMEVRVVPNTEEAFFLAEKEAALEGSILVCGSFFLAGEIEKILGAGRT